MIINTKLIINENERGFISKNGQFQRMLLPGKHSIKKYFGETYIKTTAKGSVLVNGIDIKILLKDENFANSIMEIKVPDLHFAILYEDGKVIGTLKAGTYYYWTVFHDYTYEIIDTTKPTVNLSKDKLGIIPMSYLKKATVPQGHIGLLFFDNEFQGELLPGTYYYWKNVVDVSCELVDLRSQHLEINSQEILTYDKVSLRLNFVCVYKICDAIKINSTLKDYKNQIYVTTQLALREYVGKLKFDELLEQKDNIASIILSKLKEKEESLYIQFTDAGLKDIILPGEVRDIMNTVLIAEKKAQANVISRREEVASTRSLLNTAKLMEDNTTLYKLKELEYLEKICDKVGNISVGNGNLLSELGGLLNSK